MFKDKEPRKEKSVPNWEKEERFKQSMVETIQYIQKTHTNQKGHPRPCRDGTQLGEVCQILLLWKHINIRR